MCSIIARLSAVVSMHWPLTSAFGWRMTVCLLATIAISGVALGALFKPLAYERSKEKAMKGPRKSTSQEVVMLDFLSTVHLCDSQNFPLESRSSCRG